MPTTTTNKTAYYRRCRIHPAHQQTLQQLISAAIADKSIVRDRWEATDPAASSFRVIADCKEVNGVLCGTVLSFERGKFQLVVDDDPDATSLVMTAIEPPKNEGKDRQYVPGALFFAVYENHVAIVQTSSLKASAFENHLAWLLRDQTALLSATHGLVLADEPKTATVEKIRASHVKSVSVGMPFMSKIEQVVAVDQTGAVQKTRGRKKINTFRPESGIIQMLRSVLPEDDFSSLGIEEAVFDGNLEVNLEISYPTRQRKAEAKATKLMDDIAIAFRNQDEDTIMLTLADGTPVRGQDLKIKKQMPMTLEDGVPELVSFYADLSAWLSGLVTDRVVAP